MCLKCVVLTSGAIALFAWVLAFDATPVARAQPKILIASTIVSQTPACRLRNNCGTIAGTAH